LCPLAPSRFASAWARDLLFVNRGAGNAAPRRLPCANPLARGIRPYGATTYGKKAPPAPTTPSGAGAPLAAMGRPSTTPRLTLHWYLPRKTSCTLLFFTESRVFFLANALPRLYSPSCIPYRILPRSLLAC